MSNPLYDAFCDAVLSLLEEDNPLLPEELVVRFPEDEYAELAKCFRIGGLPINPKKQRSFSYKCHGQTVFVLVDEKFVGETVH